MSNFITRTLSLPPDLSTRIDERVNERDTDFSKYIRNLVRKDLSENSPPARRQPRSGKLRRAA